MTSRKIRVSKKHSLRQKYQAHLDRQSATRPPVADAPNVSTAPPQTQAQVIDVTENKSKQKAPPNSKNYLMNIASRIPRIQKKTFEVRQDVRVKRGITYRSLIDSVSLSETGKELLIFKNK